MAVRMAEKARSVDDVGFAFKDGAQDDRVLVRVVFQVGVLDDHDVAGGFAKPAGDRRALPMFSSCSMTRTP